MGELTKIAAILFKNLSDALLTTASELKRLDSAAPLSQAHESIDLISLEEHRLIKLPKYEVHQVVLWRKKGDLGHVAVKILEILEDNKYKAFYPTLSKKDTRILDHEEILGLYPRKHGLRN